MRPKRIKGDTVPWKGHRCPVCGASHLWPLYVFAHWRDVLTHSCTTPGCSVVVELFNGTVQRVDS